MVRTLIERVRPLLFVYLFTFMVLALLRLALLVTYPESFAALSWQQMFAAFAHGLRFDSGLVTLAFSPLLLALLLPLGSGWQRIWLYLGAIPLLAIVLLGLGSIGYFGEVGRHIGNEIAFLADDVHLLLDLALNSRLGLFVFGLVFSTANVVCWIWLVSRLDLGCYPASWIYKVLASVVLVPVLVLAGRGWVLDGKPLNIVDAYALGGQAQANLALSGAYTALHSWRNLRGKSAFSDEGDTAFKSAQLGVNPHIQQYPAHELQGKNIVFVLLESWSHHYIDELAGNAYGATPNMDRLIKDSLVFDYHYAAAQRSIQGIQAILTGVPVLPGQPKLSEGLELVDMPRIGNLAADAGYASVMVQSSTRRSFRMDAVAASLGIEQYFGQEDLPLLREYPQAMPRFGWDYEALTFFHQNLDAVSAQEKPFFGFVFTGTTHEPFADPGTMFHIHPHDPSGEHGFLNTLKYSDWALGEFMASARQSEWFDDTVFIFTSDHVLRAEGQDLEKNYRIPLVIYAPGLVEPGRREQITSQYDLLPTLLHLMGATEPFVALGRSIFSEQHADEAWITQGEMVGCGFHAIRPPSPLSSGQAFHGHLATCSTAIRPGSRSAATQGL
ncbi:LTA synthase family protein, partial [Pseudomonas aeruginosa]